MLVMKGKESGPPSCMDVEWVGAAEVKFTDLTIFWCS
jgi:hypothetical protein